MDNSSSLFRGNSSQLSRAAELCRGLSYAMNILFDSAPSFDQPLAVLKHCHDRIRKQINTLHQLLSHLPMHGADASAQQAARAVIRYFTIAAPMHHADEETDLLPMLLATAQGEEALRLRVAVDRIEADHIAMAISWQTLHLQLEAIAAAESASLSATNVHAFTEQYTSHMTIEEEQIAPLAQKIFSAEQLAMLGSAMQKRRQIQP